MTMGQNVVITGANRGLGLALTKAYVRAGANVIAGCRTPAAATELAATGAEVHALDLGEQASIDAFVAVVGDRPVDVLVNNAGLDARAFGAADAERDVLTLDTQVFNDVMQVNTIGPMMLTRGLAPALRSAAGAKVVMVTSQVGSMVVAQRIGRDVSYTASKAALNMVAVKFAQALKGDGIAVIAMHPGYLRTDMGGSGADLDPDDAAEQIRTTIGELTMERTSTFLRWDGTEHPW
jgi:NAD(P)-dependent dehydrogenase (short-subunit alcohol dehydrogenase family)